jgi:hypothetical protein
VCLGVVILTRILIKNNVEILSVKNITIIETEGRAPRNLHYDLPVTLKSGKKRRER